MNVSTAVIDQSFGRQIMTTQIMVRGCWDYSRLPLYPLWSRN